jgi:molybdopterin molybdotransferase
LKCDKSRFGHSVDTVVRYEDISIQNGIATINTDINKGQNIHEGKPKEGAILVKANQVISPAIIGIAASVGKTTLSVKSLKIVIISTETKW